MNILVVEDESRVADFIRRGLRAEGWQVRLAHDGHAALSSLASDSFDVVVMDIMLPDLDGRELCRRLRDLGDTTPILLLTALSAVEERVQGLRSGADDYLPKPFDFDELLARIEALARRARPLAQIMPSSPGADRLRLVPEAQAVQVGDTVVQLTPKEFEVLALLAGSPGKIFSRERILSRVWSLQEDPLTNIVDVYIRRLRKKLGAQGEPIETVRGAGYRIGPIRGGLAHV